MELNLLVNNEIMDSCTTRIDAYLSPHPCDEDTIFHEDDLKWIPGFDDTDDADGLGVAFNENNLALYDSIAQLTMQKVEAAFGNLSVLFNEHIIKDIFVRIDLYGLSGSDTALAGYNYNASRPHAGAYQFTADKLLLEKYILNEQFNSSDKFCYTWEHEFLHMLDYRLLEKTAVFRESKLDDDQFKCYLLKYREEGFAELYYLLHGNYDTINSVEQAQNKFLSLVNKVNDFRAEHLVVPRGVYDCYDFYSVGPWLLLDMLRYFEGMFHQEMIDEAIETIKQKKAVDKEKIFEIITIALRIDVRFFLEYCNSLINNVSVHNL
jgi:hypothetical protein